jgi:tetratricopeptide (TPR) repeat protein
MNRARELDPMSVDVRRTLADLYISGFHDYVKGLELVNFELEIEPNSMPANWHLGMIYIYQERNNEALAQFEKYKKLFPEDKYYIKWPFALLYARMGERGKARATLSDLIKDSEQDHVAPYFLSSVFAQLGETDRAFEALERAYLQRDPNILGIMRFPLLEPIRSDPRFAALLKKIGLEK